MTQRKEPLHVALAALGVTLLWIAFAGRDLSWDVINHHVYLPFSLFHGRFREDLFAAGPQSYQNPIGYVPFYALLKSGAPSWLTGAILATIHALAAWPLYRICVQIWGDSDEAKLWRWMALALAWATPAFLLVVGTSSVDVISSVLVLWAVAAVIATPSSTGRYVLAGLALGLSFAIKPVNAPFIIGLAAVGLLRCFTSQQRWSDWIALLAGIIGAILLFQGPWSYWLWQDYGNPLFPLFNDLFQSPYAPTQAIVSERFTPKSVVDYLWRPFEMALYKRYSVAEEFIPDIRPALAVLFGLPVLMVATFRHRRQAKALASRADFQFLIFVLVSYLLWMKSSGNARYAVVLLMCFGPILVRSVQLALPPSLARVVVLLALVLQLAYYGHDGVHRLDAARWDSRSYVHIDVPERLTAQPFLHLSLGTQSMAAVATKFHPDGRLINLIGQFTLPTDGVLGDALKGRLDQWRGRTRILIMAANEGGNVVVAPKIRERGNDVIYRYGLKFNFDDCEPIRIVRRAKEDDDDYPIVSCAAVPSELDNKNFERDNDRADKAFAIMEARCPSVLTPVPLVSDTDLVTWQRRYVNKDVRVQASITEGVTMSHYRSLQMVYLGTIDEVLSGTGADPCKAWYTAVKPE